MTQSLEDLTKEINVRLVKSDNYDGKADDLVRDLRQKAEDHRIAAGKLMIEARKLVEAGEAGDVTWTKWCSQNINRCRQDIHKIMKIAGHVEPEKALKDERAAAREGMAKHRDKLENVANGEDVSDIPQDENVELTSDDESADDSAPEAQRPADPPVASTPPSPEPIVTGVKVDDELLKWTAAFRSWPWPRREMALSLIEVDEDSVAALKEDHDLLELKDTLLDAQREKIGQLEQENRSLRERLASQLDPKTEPDQHREPEEAEPEQAKPVISDVVDEPKPAAPEVTVPKPGMSEPELSAIDRAVLQIFQDRAASNSSPWIGIVGREDLNIDEDAVDRLAAAGLLVQSPANPHSYAVTP